MPYLNLTLRIPFWSANTKRPCLRLESAAVSTPKKLCDKAALGNAKAALKIVKLVNERLQSAA